MMTSAAGRTGFVINHGRSHFQNASSDSCSFRHDSIVVQIIIPFRIFWLSDESPV